MTAYLPKSVSIVSCRLAADPELKYTPQGKAVLNVNAATQWWDAAAKTSQTQWMRLAAWDELAEELNASGAKGSLYTFVVVDLHNRTYERRDGGEGISYEGVIKGILDEVPEEVAQFFREAKNGSGGDHEEEKPLPF